MACKKIPLPHFRLKRWTGKHRIGDAVFSSVLRTPKLINLSSPFPLHFSSLRGRCLDLRLFLLEVSMKYCNCITSANIKEHQQCLFRKKSVKNL